jgi:hypothetical protein
VQLKGYFFNLGGLIRDSNQTSEGEDIDATDYQVVYTRPGSSSGVTEKVSLNFNICETTNRKCENQESNEDDFANIKVNSKCKHLTENDLADIDVNLIDNEDPGQGLKLTYTGGDQCNATHYYTLDLKLICDEKALEPSYAI